MGAVYPARSRTCFLDCIITKQILHYIVIYLSDTSYLSVRRVQYLQAARCVGRTCCTSLVKGIGWWWWWGWGWCSHIIIVIPFAMCKVQRLLYHSIHVIICSFPWNVERGVPPLVRRYGCGPVCTIQIELTLPLSLSHSDSPSQPLVGSSLSYTAVCFNHGVQ